VQGLEPGGTHQSVPCTTHRATTAGRPYAVDGIVGAGLRTRPLCAWATTEGRPYAVDGIVGAGLRARPWATTAGRPYADQDHVP
jgi:hypothetical protein